MDYFEFAAFSQCLCLDRNNITSFFEPLSAAEAKQGGFGTVIPVKLTTEGKKRFDNIPKTKKICYKQISTTRNTDFRTLKNEIDILKQLKEKKAHYSVHYYGCFFNRDNVYVVMDYVEGGQNLQDIINSNDLSTDTKLHYAYEIYKAIKEIHDMDILHRDIKPANVMVSLKGEIKLIDYGISCKFALHPKVMGCVFNNAGTPGYRDPHLTLMTSITLKLADWWAYGQLLVYLFTKTHKTYKFKYNMEKDTYYHLTDDELAMFPVELRSVIQDLSDPTLHPNQRPDENTIETALHSAIEVPGAPYPRTQYPQHIEETLYDLQKKLRAHRYWTGSEILSPDELQRRKERLRQLKYDESTVNELLSPDELKRLKKKISLYGSNNSQKIVAEPIIPPYKIIKY